MLKLEDINAAIEEREQQDRLSDEVCSELCWLYTIRNEIEKRNKPKPINAPMLYSQANSPIKRTYSENEVQPLTLEEAEEWTSNMENEDGTVGPHWSLEQAKEIMARKQISGSPIDFYACLNMEYSDVCAVAKKFCVDTLDFYVALAESFLNDKDVESGKLERYYEFVVQ